MSITRLLVSVRLLSQFQCRDFRSRRFQGFQSFVRRVEGVCRVSMVQCVRFFFGYRSSNLAALRLRARLP